MMRGQQGAPTLRRLDRRRRQAVGCEQESTVAELGLEMAGDRVADRLLDVRRNLHGVTGPPAHRRPRHGPEQLHAALGRRRSDRHPDVFDEGGRVRDGLLVLVQDRPERLVAPAVLVGLVGAASRMPISRSAPSRRPQR